MTLEEIIKQINEFIKKIYSSEINWNAIFFIVIILIALIFSIEFLMDDHFWLEDLFG